MTLFDWALRHVGIKELAGQAHHPLIQWWLSLCKLGHDTPDETPWCSAFINGGAWTLRLPRSYSAAARSWLRVGEAISLDDAVPGQNDIVVLWRGDPNGWQGHVGVLAGVEGGTVHLLSGNQGDAVSVAPFPISQVLGARRLA
jgi:uncharacterized protein (TIGR02594 family)